MYDLTLVAGDRLVDAVLGGMNGRILLVPPRSPVPALVSIARNKARPTWITVYGSTAELPDSQIKHLIGQAHTLGRSDTAKWNVTAVSMSNVYNAAWQYNDEAPPIGNVIIASTAQLGIAALAGPVILMVRNKPPGVEDLASTWKEPVWEGPIEVLGGSPVLPDPQVGQLLELMKVPPSVKRVALGSSDPIATSVILARRQFPEHARKVYLVAADSPADAIAAMQGATGPIVMVPGCGRLPRNVAEALAGWRPAEVVAIGDEKTVCPPMLAQAANSTWALPGYKAVATADSRSSACAVTSTGLVRCWGWFPRPRGPRLLLEPMTMPGLPKDVVDVTVAEEDGYCARTRRGAVWCFGAVLQSYYGRGIDPVPIRGLESRVTRMWLGWRNYCAQKRDGSIGCWGSRPWPWPWLKGATYQQAVPVKEGAKAVPGGLPKARPDTCTIDKRGRVRCNDWSGAGGRTRGQPEVVGFGT